MVPRDAQTLVRVVAGADPLDFAMVDAILVDPIVQAPLADTELHSDPADRLAGPHERNSSQTELGWIWSWHDVKPSKEDPKFTAIRVTNPSVRSRCHQIMQQSQPPHPGWCPRQLGADLAAKLLRRVHPRDDLTTRRMIALDLIAEIGRLDKRIDTVTGRLITQATAARTTLTTVTGIGSLIAARILARTETFERFPSDNFPVITISPPTPGRHHGKCLAVTSCATGYLGVGTGNLTVQCTSLRSPKFP